MKLRLRENHLLLFCITGKQKWKGFFTPQRGSFADYYGHLTGWVVDMGKNCSVVHDGITVGSKVILRDVYELERVPPSIVQMYVDKISFREKVIEEMNLTGGGITAAIVHSNSLMAVEEECQTSLKLSSVTGLSEKVPSGPNSSRQGFGLPVV